jgi:hypothetical protein
VTMPNHRASFKTSDAIVLSNFFIKSVISSPAYTGHPQEGIHTP